MFYATELYANLDRILAVVVSKKNLRTFKNVTKSVIIFLEFRNYKNIFTSLHARKVLKTCRDDFVHLSGWFLAIKQVLQNYSSVYTQITKLSSPWTQFAFTRLFHELIFAYRCASSIISQSELTHLRFSRWAYLEVILPSVEIHDGSKALNSRLLPGIPVV